MTGSDTPLSRLAVTDLVFVDPIGTGYTHAVGDDKDDKDENYSRFTTADAGTNLDHRAATFRGLLDTSVLGAHIGQTQHGSQVARIFFG